VYPSHSSVLSAFQSGFRLLQWQGIGLCIPPSYIRLPDWAMERLSGFDGALSCGPALRALADHRLYVFERL
jgi:hypothetical protein